MPRTSFSLLLVGSVAITTVAGANNSVAEILVGYAGPLTGEMALASEGMQNGVELAIAELNAGGGVLGQKVTLDLVDDYCDAEQALAAARKLLADRVAVVIGHRQSPHPCSTRQLGFPSSRWRPALCSPAGAFV
jgi:ABC-type branched-subunit amino acid transport system substrate-binding protein